MSDRRHTGNAGDPCGCRACLEADALVGAPPLAPTWRCVSRICPAPEQPADAPQYASPNGWPVAERPICGVCYERRSAAAERVAALNRDPLHAPEADGVALGLTELK